MISSFLSDLMLENLGSGGLGWEEGLEVEVPMGWTGELTVTPGERLNPLDISAKVETVRKIRF